MPQDEIELLSVELLDQHRPLVNDLRRLAGSLGLEFGWHYLLDLTWIISRLEAIRGQRILDAGAGTGILQWYLAQNGAEVISVDRGSRARLPIHFRTRFRVQGLRPADLVPTARVFSEHLLGRGSKLPVMAWARESGRDVLGMLEPRRSPGRVLIYNQNLLHLADVPDNSLAAVVAVSALEHNPPDNLEQVVAELMRVLRPGGVLLASLTAARDQDWWHDASSGWCYTGESLRRLFCLPAAAPSNWGRYDELFAALKGNAELRDGLAKFYFRSGNNGMPWGKWDPQYLPVGVCKVKK